MLLRQLKQFTLSAARRNAVFGTDVKQLARFYGSPAVCESLTTTSKAYKRLSKEDRRVLVESYVNEYRANNAGKFPSVTATRKAVGGSPYILRVILQELKLRPKADVPIVAKALSEVSVSPSVPDGSSSHFSPVVVEPEFQAGSLDIEIGTEQRQDIIDSSLSDSDGESNLQGNNLVITATDEKRETETSQRIEVEVCLKNSETEEEGNLTHVGNQESKADHLEGATGSAADDESNLQGNNNLVISATDDKRETETSQRIEVEVCLKNLETEEEGNLTRFGNQESIAGHLEVTTGSAADDESNLQGNNLVINATKDERETETSQRIEVEVSLKNSETEEEGNVMHLGNQESISDHLEGAAVSADDESNLQGNNNLVITATDDTKETETSQRIEVEVCLKNSETEEEGNLTHLGNQETKADHLEGAVSADVVPTDTRQVSETGAHEVKETGAHEVKETGAHEVKETGAHEVKETGAGEVKEERSSAWSNLLSFAKDFASIWRR